MAVQDPKRCVEARIELDIPDTREYDSVADAELDRKLVEAIKTAENTDNSNLAQLLRQELGSHYYSSQ